MKHIHMIKRITSSLSLFIFILTCSAFGVYYYLYYSTIPHYQQALHKMAQTRTEQINTFLNTQENYALQLSKEPALINLLKNNTATTDQAIVHLLSTQQSTMGFKNIFLINNTGTILFSTTKDNIANISITESRYKNSSLSQSYQRASMTLTTDFSSFNFNDVLNEPALFITIPVLEDKKFIGTLAYQLDQEKIYLIAHQYIGLEKTGEVVLAYKEGEFIIFAAPTRHDQDLAFKKRAISTDKPILIQKSILGQNGYGTGIDYQGNAVVGAWHFIPKLDWGMVVKINRDEIVSSMHTIYIIFLLCLLLLLISLLCNTYLWWPSITRASHHLNTEYPYNKIPLLLKNPLFILFIIFLGFSAKNIILCKWEMITTIKKAQEKAIRLTTENAENIDTVLQKIIFVGKSIAQDLHTNYLRHDDITTRIERDTKENNSITEISVVQENGLLKSTNIELQNSPIQNIIKTPWYTQALEKGSTWVINIPKDEKLAQPTTTYACTFSDENNQSTGVIAITARLSSIIDITDNSGIGKTGYSFIITDKGRFIYHPLQQLVQNQTTLLQYAQSKGNEELATVAEKVTAQQSMLASYNTESSQERMWMYTHPVAASNWIIGTIFTEDEIDMPADVLRHYYFWILLWLTITLLCGCALLSNYNIFSLTYYTTIANGILIIALSCSWYIIKKTTTVERESRTIITDQSSLNKFLNDLNEEAQRKHEALPVNIPSGILLYSLANTGQDTITVSGYLWNKYNTALQTNIIRGMDLPQATRMVYGIPLLSKFGDEETSTWNIQGTMYQEQKYEKFPFDQQQIRIMLEHKDIEKNIILTPDLIAYKKISPEATPGLDKDFSLSGFTIEQTFFEYQKVDPNANFGFKEYGKVTDNYHLVYNIIINRNLINPFVIYLLPLLVILFSLFTTLLIIKKTTSPFSILGGYSGLFFALILLQRSLREQYPSASTLYMEYAFFYTYITIILLILHTLIMYYYKQWDFFQNKSLYLMRILFWPFQFAMWLITTLIIFY
ncbi:MAG TPA: cache domain-containing protein [Candidatus Babeliales bacterium]|nr:cache domain-containing protein [Candidatus Babeliales bacterium]